MTTGRWVAYAGFALAGVMVVLGLIGTTNAALFYTWCVLALLGLGVGALGRKLDSDAVARRVNQTQLRD